MGSALEMVMGMRVGNTGSSLSLDWDCADSEPSKTDFTHLTNHKFLRVELMKPQVINQFADALESEAFRAEGFAHRIGQKLIWMAGTKPLLVGKHPEVRSGLTPKKFGVGKKVVRR